MKSPKELRHRVSSSHNQNGTNSHRRVPMSSAKSNEHSGLSKSRRALDKLDDESGSLEYEYELASSLNDEKKLGSGTAISHGNDDEEKAHVSAPPINRNDADDTKNSSDSDVRSRSLFLHTAFWITCWYGTSLATLFLNKIILSRPGSSVHVLGMCQMTTAAVLGGWTSQGGGEWIQRQVSNACQFLPDPVKNKLCCLGLVLSKNAVDKGGNTRTPGPLKTSARDTTTNSSSQSGSVNFHFIRDMSIVGLLRGATVVLGLVALEHVPVSFVETIKATAPAFTVLFARIILKERTATPVMLTLFPVVAGLILCSASELRFDTIGFVAAVMNNCADCVQNVMSKRMLTHLKPTQLQFYTSVAALTLQAPFVVRDAGMLIRNWTAPEDEPIIIKGTEKGSLASLGIGKLLLIDAIFYHLQSVSAYCTMGCMSPVSQSVANTLKRALLVWASILYFGNPVTSNGVIGIIMVVSGVFLYNHVRRVNQR
jgi:solute carrier family 35 protein E2